MANIISTADRDTFFGTPDSDFIKTLADNVNTR